MTASKNISCYNCNSELEFEAGAKITRHDECDKCKANLRCCKMCLFYDVLVYNECKEPNAERILDKERPNFCGYFEVGSASNNSNDRDQLFADANALFKDN